MNPGATIEKITQQRDIAHDPPGNPAEICGLPAHRLSTRLWSCAGCGRQYTANDLQQYASMDLADGEVFDAGPFCGALCERIFARGVRAGLRFSGRA